MNKLLSTCLGLILLAGVPWQETINGRFHGGSGNWSLEQVSTSFACIGGVSTCVLPVSSTTASSAMTLGVGTAPSDNLTITSVTGGGGTWTLCSASACHAGNGGAAGYLDLASNRTGTGGATALTVHLSGTPGSGWFAVLIELKRSTGGTPAIDGIAQSVTASCTACVLGTLSPFTGTSEGVAIMVGAEQTPTTISSPYVIDTNLVGAYGSNISASTAPTQNQTPTGQMVTTEIGYK